MRRISQVLHPSYSLGEEGDRSRDSLRGVVPANAGTHTVQYLGCAARPDAFHQTSARDYGSLLSQGRPVMFVTSRRFLEQFAPYQHAPDFAGAGADLVNLGVPQQPPRWIVVDIAVAAEQ